MTDSDSSSDVEGFRRILVSTSARRNSTTLPKKFASLRSGSASSGGGSKIWDELEALYRDMEQREKDYTVAVEIGKMLLDKNQDLQDYTNILKQQLDALSGESTNEVGRLLKENEELVTQRDELKTQVKNLKLQMSLLQSGKGDSEMKAFLLSDEFGKMEEKLTKFQREIEQYRQKNVKLSEELEKCKSELESTKEELEQIRKYRRQIPVRASSNEELTPDDLLDREKLAEEMTALALSKTKLEEFMGDLSIENKKLRECITEKEDQRGQLERMIDSLSKANYMLQKQQEEERQLLEEKINTISSLQAKIEEQTFFMGAPTVNDSLQFELLNTSKENSFMSPPSPIGNVPPSPGVPGMPSEVSLFEDDEDEELSRLSMWKERLTTLEMKNMILQQKEEELIRQGVLHEEDKQWLIEELQRFRKCKSEEHIFLSIIYELRQRLFDAEIKNLTRTMRNIVSFADIVLYSNSILESVIRDVQRRILVRESINDIDMIRLVADLILENCKLRRVANDYSEAINQGTVEKLEKFKRYWPVDGKMGNTPNKKNSNFWNGSVFDFFTGWKQPPEIHSVRRNMA